MIAAIRADRSTKLDAQTKQRIKRHRIQICYRSDADQLPLCRMFAIAFRPGDQTGTFLRKSLRPVGTAVMVVLSYSAPDDPSAAPWRMPLRGFRGRVTSDGFLEYGGSAGCDFLYDVSRRPFPGAKGWILDPARNPSLVDLVHQMDSACVRRTLRTNWLRRMPSLPRLMLAFPPNDPPRFEVSAYLRSVAARQIGVPVERLGGNGSTLLERLLHDTWEASLVMPGVPGNTTGCILISSDVCTQTGQALSIYEDFSELLGLCTWNPARQAEPVRLANPARKVFASLGVCKDEVENLSAEMVEALERAMRSGLESVGGRLRQDEIYDAIVTPDQPIIVWSLSLNELRSKLTSHISECTTDEDLLRAARSPDNPLVASGACKIQVLGLRDEPTPEALCFGPDDLGRRVRAQLWVDRWMSRRVIA